MFIKTKYRLINLEQVNFISYDHDSISFYFEKDILVLQVAKPSEFIEYISRSIGMYSVLDVSNFET